MPPLPRDAALFARGAGGRGAMGAAGRARRAAPGGSGSAAGPALGLSPALSRPSPMEL